MSKVSLKETPSWKEGDLQVVDLLVDLIGIEPMTSSMPWNCRKRKLLTAKWLEVGETGKTGKIAPL